MPASYAPNHPTQDTPSGGSARTLVDITEMSRRLGNVAVGTLYNWVYLRRIPFVKAGRCLRFDPEKVLAALPHFPGMIDQADKR
jgi:hypothetical protein